MKKICIIGNNAGGNIISDGGRIKIRLFQNLLIKNNCNVFFIDLFNWKLKIFQIISDIKKAIKTCESIIIMAGPKGCRFIIPIVNYLNKKYHKKIIFCPVGIGTLDKVVSSLTPEQVTNFIKCGNFYNLKDVKMKKQLSKLNLIVLENQFLYNTYINFYSLDNCSIMTNFRDISIIPRKYSPFKTLKMIYASRITSNKGIFDLLKAIDICIDHGLDISLDIYGDLQLNELELSTFNSYLNDKIKYMGVAKSDEMISILSKYDLFCLPTKYHGEGTPGVLIESLISGTPVLVSSYGQVQSLVCDQKTGILFEINNINSLIEKIKFCFNNYDLLREISKNSQIHAKQFTFEGNKEKFFEYILGGSK